MAVLLDEPERPALLRATVDGDLLAPPTLPWEIGNAFSALVKRRRLTWVAVRRAWAAYERIPVQLVAVSIPRSLELAARLGLYAYDAYVLEAARAHGASVLTLDRRLVSAAQMAGVGTVEVEP